MRLTPGSGVVSHYQSQLSNERFHYESTPQDPEIHVEVCGEDGETVTSQNDDDQDDNCYSDSHYLMKRSLASQPNEEASVNM